MENIMKPLSSDQFREKLMAIMDRKDHWAWPHFCGPQITKAQLETHFRQEYAVYVRDFQVFLSRIHGKNRSEEHTSELQSPCNLVCRLLLEKKKKQQTVVH